MIIMRLRPLPNPSPGRKSMIIMRLRILPNHSPGRKGADLADAVARVQERLALLA